MRGIVTFLVLVGLFSLAMLVAVPTMDGIVPVVTGMTPGPDPTILNIRAAVVKWSVPVFLFATVGWVVFWILRQERQQVR